MIRSQDNAPTCLETVGSEPASNKLSTVDFPWQIFEQAKKYMYTIDTFPLSNVTQQKEREREIIYPVVLSFWEAL